MIRPAHELGRAEESVAEHLRHGTALLEGVTEVERDRVLEQPDVLRGQRVVRPQALVDLVDGLLGANGPASCRPTFPGSTLTITNTMVTISHSVMIDIITRRVT